MAVSWHSSDTGERLASDTRSISWPPLRIEIALPDRAVLLRYVRHAAALLLVAVVAWNVLPDATWTSPGSPLTTLAGARVPAEPLPVYAPSGRPATAGYLGAAVVPSTSLALRSILPFALSQPSPRVRADVIEYTVQPGDTVIGIAARFGLQESTLVWANEELDSDPDFLSIGQAMVIPPVDGVYHTVARGESVASIAAKYKVEPEVIVNYPANGLTEASALAAGQKLMVPGGIRPAPPRPAPAPAPAAPAATAPAASQPSAAAPANAPVGSGQFVYPIMGRISQYFGRGHLGIDLYAPLGTPVYAADDGYVSSVNYRCDGWACGYGRWVVIEHGNGLQTLYAHLQSASVQPGETVSRGQQIGTCGSVGKSTGPHLHFEVIRHGTRVNPFGYLP